MKVLKEGGRFRNFFMDCWFVTRSKCLRLLCVACLLTYCIWFLDDYLFCCLLLWLHHSCCCCLLLRIKFFWWKNWLAFDFSSNRSCLAAVWSTYLGRTFALKNTVLCGQITWKQQQRTTRRNSCTPLRLCSHCFNIVKKKNSNGSSNNSKSTTHHSQQQDKTRQDSYIQYEIHHQTITVVVGEYWYFTIESSQGS